MQTVPLQYSQTQSQVRINSFIRSVYNWMTLGLAITGFIAYVVASTSLKNIVFGNPMLMIVLFIAELVLVISLVARIGKMKASTATKLFILYAGLNGVVLSSIFIVYRLPAISSTFFICAATFLACSIYGMNTKRDLTGLGSFMFMGLIGIIIASVVNIFIGSYGMSMIISYIGVIVFVGLTAYDTQKLKHMAMTQPSGTSAAVVRKGAIIGALALYLDFINLFLFLLRIFGGSSRN